MECQVFVGTLSEIQRQLSGLPCAPDKRLRVTIEAAVPQRAKPSHVSNAAATVIESGTEAEGAPAIVAEPFRPTEYRNGVPLLPRREIVDSITTEFVKRLLDEEDEERLRAHRSAGR